MATDDYKNDLDEVSAHQEEGQSTATDQSAEDQSANETEPAAVADNGSLAEAADTNPTEAIETPKESEPTPYETETLQMPVAAPSPTPDASPEPETQDGASPAVPPAAVAKGPSFVTRLLSTRNGRIVAGVAAAAVLLMFLFGTHIICFHNWQDATCTKPEICSRGEALGHVWLDPTCTEPETCERCGETSGDALGHQIDKWKTTKKATCTAEGVREGTCVRCGEVQTESIAKTDHEFGEWKVTKEATCTEAGERTRTCKNCDEKQTEEIAKVDHTPGDWEVLTAPKVSSNGSVTAGTKVRKCTACGEVLDTESYTLDITKGQANALASAASYLNFTAFSFDGLVDQLEYEGFSHDDAVFAAENCGANWSEQAAKMAKNYLSFTAFSFDGLVNQLEYEGFSHDDAVSAADNCGADWNEQAAKMAQNYLDFTSFSRSGLIDQLVYEGFTQEQAEYGATAVGY